jgi:hypothetical protein
MIEKFNAVHCPVYIDFEFEENNELSMSHKIGPKIF